MFATMERTMAQVAILVVPRGLLLEEMGLSSVGASLG